MLLEAPLLAPPAASPVPVHWSPASRIAFRVAFLYFFCFLFLFGNGTVFQMLPKAGAWIEDKLTWPMNHVAEWAGQHVFHLTGVGAHFHPTGSGDTAVDWVLQLVFVVFALVGALLWTALSAARGHRRAEYGTMYAWLRFLLRLTCAMFMLGYGLDKLFPLQMAPVSIAVLNEPVGQSSPMTLLWSLIGMNPVYEMVCGLAEVVGGVLLLFRRTALLGALLSAFVMANVVLYNFFFDVPVKLFASNLLLALLFIALPDVRPLWNFFWRHTPDAPAGVWVPPAKRRAFRITTRVVEIVALLAFVGVQGVMSGMAWRKARVAERTSSPWLGAWHLDAAHPASGAMITSGGLPATDLYVDSVVRAFTRSSDRELWRTRLNIDPQAHTVQISDYVSGPVTYAWQMPDHDHMVLTSMPPKDAKAAASFKPEAMSFTRIPVPAHYPLLDRGFHLVNEWGLER